MSEFVPEPEALKACPFCGGDPSSILHDGHDAIKCFRCGARGPARFMEAEAWKAWDNRRPTPAAASEPIPMWQQLGFSCAADEAAYREKMLGTRPAEDRRADDVDGIPTTEQVQALTAERDALKAQIADLRYSRDEETARCVVAEAQIERLTSDAAVEAAIKAITTTAGTPTNIQVKAALAAALRVARGEG